MKQEIKEIEENKEIRKAKELALNQMKNEIAEYAVKDLHRAVLTGDDVEVFRTAERTKLMAGTLDLLYFVREGA